MRDFREHELDAIAADRQKLDEREARIRRELAVWDARGAFVQTAAALASALRTMWQAHPDLYPGDSAATRFVDAAEEAHRLGAWDGWVAQDNTPKGD